MSLFPVVVGCYSHLLTLSASLPWSIPQVCRQNCNDICHTVGDISTSVWMATLLFPVITQCHIYLWTLSFSLLWSKTCVYCARITVILTSDLFGCMSPKTSNEISTPAEEQSISGEAKHTWSVLAGAKTSERWPDWNVQDSDRQGKHWLYTVLHSGTYSSQY